jgi:hypothetical protein
VLRRRGLKGKVYDFVVEKMVHWLILKY